MEIRKAQGEFAGAGHKPNSVSLQNRSGNHSSGPWIAPGIMRSTQEPRTGRPLIPFGIALLFDLAPCGVFRAAAVANGAVRSYRTFSPLPPQGGGGVFSVALSVGSPLPRVTRRTALWSSDFPRFRTNRNRDCLADSGVSMIRFRPLPPQLRPIIRSDVECLLEPNGRGEGRVLHCLAFASAAAGTGFTRPRSSRSLTSRACEISA